MVKVLRRSPVDPIHTGSGLGGGPRMSQKKLTSQSLMVTNKSLMWKYNSNKNNSDPNLVALALNKKL